MEGGVCLLEYAAGGDVKTNTREDKVRGWESTWTHWEKRRRRECKEKRRDR